MKFVFIASLHISSSFTAGTHLLIGGQIEGIRKRSRTRGIQQPNPASSPNKSKKGNQSR